jgi:N-acetylglucosaminyldiphosphoundecaprenol N-acetyl-beta-D-mannosaminyltransferase
VKFFNVHFNYYKARNLSSYKRDIAENECFHIAVVDGNVLRVANANPDYREFLNQSYANICDGKSISRIGNLIHGIKLKRYCGPDFMEDLIRSRFYKSMFLGATDSILNRLRNNLIQLDPAVEHMQFISLPMLDVDKFDYENIAECINADNPDIIWVSLGAPKQEFFIRRLEPLCRRGLFVGVGAAFFFHSGLPQHSRPPVWVRKAGFEWLYRSIKSRRIAARACLYMISLPRLVIKEIWKVRILKQTEDPK